MTKQLASIGPVLPCSYNGAHILERPKRLKFRQGIGRQWAGHACGRDGVTSSFKPKSPGCSLNEEARGLFPALALPAERRGCLRIFRKRKRQPRELCHGRHITVTLATMPFWPSAKSPLSEPCHEGGCQSHTGSMKQRKTIEVVAAIIIRYGKLSATQRGGYGKWKDWWELSGGKIEQGIGRLALKLG